MTLDAQLITELITCEKEIIQPPSDPKQERGHFRIGFELQSVDRKFFFKAFGRYNAAFNENFSVGLTYFPKMEKGSYEIIRCNGPHGEHRMFPHHVHFHVHKITPEAIAVGLKEDSFIEITDRYATYEEALQFFVKLVHLRKQDIDRYFPPRQLDIFETK